jgi:hypothetical protein
MVSVVTLPLTLRRGRKKVWKMLKRSIIWKITPYSPLKINRHFEGTCRLHLQVRQETSVKSGGKQSSAFNLVSYFDPEVGGYMFLWKRTTRRYFPEDKNSSLPPLWKPQILHLKMFIVVSKLIKIWTNILSYFVTLKCFSQRCVL